MAGEIGAVGDVVSGALLARAVEPDTGVASPSAAGKCLNCKTELAGAYCHHCGQSTHIHRTLSSFWHDFAHSVLHFDGKVWRTLPLLVFWPGQLTRRYVHGERARFVSPLALFLLTVFIIFSVFSAGNGLNINPTVTSGGKTLNAQQIADKIEVDKAQLAQLAAQRAALHGADDEALGNKIEKLTDEIDVLDGSLSLKQGLSREELSKAHVNFHVGDAAWDQLLNEKATRAQQNPELLVVKMEEGAHKYCWIIIPLSLPFLWGTLFWRRDLKLFDHVVFVTYSACFVLGALALLTLVGEIPGLSNAGPSWIALIAPLHVFFQLKGAYGLSTWGALWRSTIVLTGMVIVLVIYAVLILIMSL